jgi:hypothetical protein
MKQATSSSYKISKLLERHVSMLVLQVLIIELQANCGRINI